jgi:hypothetical protein
LAYIINHIRNRLEIVVSARATVTQDDWLALALNCGPEANATD